MLQIEGRKRKRGASDEAWVLCFVELSSLSKL